MNEVIIVVALVCAAMGLRAFGAAWCQRVGMLGYVAAVGVAGFFLTQAWWGAVAGVLLFLLVPMMGIFWQIRGMRLPLDRKWRSSWPPNETQFPTLAELTEELEAHRYEHIDDVQARWHEAREQVRLMRHPQDKVLASITMMTDEPFQMLWVSLTVKTREGLLVSTTTSPSMSPLCMAPGVSLRYERQAASIAELLRAHAQHMVEQKVYSEELVMIEAEEATAFLEQEMRRQVDYNLDCGVIRLAGEGTFSYSWRGGVFLWVQWLRSVLA
jgi:hypothetical protein